MSERAVYSANVVHLPRRFLKLEEAAFYCGIGRTLFLQLVDEGRMPRPRRINSRLAWDLREIDLVLDEWPREGDAQVGWAHGND